MSQTFHTNLNSLFVSQQLDQIMSKLDQIISEMSFSAKRQSFLEAVLPQLRKYSISDRDLSEDEEEVNDRSDNHLDCSDGTDCQDFRRHYQSFYEKKLFFDFELKTDSNETIEVHRIILNLNDCQVVDQLKGKHVLVIENVSKTSLESIVHYLYYQRFEPQINAQNFEELIEICLVLRNDNLINRITALKLFNDLATIKKKIKRKLDSNLNNESISKRFKGSTDDSVEQLNHSLVDGTDTESVEDSNRSRSDSVINNQFMSTFVPINVETTNQISIEENQSIEQTNEELIEIGSKYTMDPNDGIIKLETNNPNVWNCLLMGSVLAVVADRCVVWYDLSLSKGQRALRLGTFDAPNGRILQSIKMTKRVNKTIYAISGRSADSSSFGFIYFCREPINDKKVDIFETLEFETEISDILFLNNQNLLCGTYDQKVMALKLNWSREVLKKESQPSVQWTDSTGFPIISLLYINFYDLLIASGESSDLMFYYQISRFKPIVFRIKVGQNINSISGLAFIPENKCFVIRSADLDHLLVADLAKIIKNLNSSQTSKFECLTKLEYTEPSQPRIEIIFMSCNSGLIGCGDHLGNSYFYEVNKLAQTETLKPMKLVLNRSVWPEHNKPPVIHSVTISDDGKLFVLTTNTNLVCFWRASDDN